MDTNESANNCTLFKSNFYAFHNTYLYAVCNSNKDTYNGAFYRSVIMAIEYTIKYTNIYTNFPTNDKTNDATVLIPIDETLLPTYDGTIGAANFAAFIPPFNATDISSIYAAIITTI